jgi:exonuclease III
VFVKSSSISISPQFGNATTSSPHTFQKVEGVTKQKKISNFFQKPSAQFVPLETIQTDDTRPVALRPCLLNVFFDFENLEKKFSGEGRTIVLETDKFFLVACYVPNSGEGLVRLKFRVDEW